MLGLGLIAFAIGIALLVRRGGSEPARQARLIAGDDGAGAGHLRWRSSPSACAGCAHDPRPPPPRDRARALLSACAATQTDATVASAATTPGFWLGVWHGFIFPVAFVISLFVPDVAIYAVPNNGGWYDFGYFVGIVFLGVGARSSKRK